MTAPDVDALEAARAAATPGPWATDGACVVPGYWGDTPPILARTNDYPDAALIVAAVNNLEALLAAVRERDALRAAVERIAEEWRYKGEFGWGPWQAGEGPDIEGQILDDAALRLRALLAAVDGGQR